MRLLEGHTDRVKHLVYSQDGRWLASLGKDRSVRVWDTAAGCQVARHPAHPGARSVAFLGDDQWLAWLHADERVRVWDWSEGGLVWEHYHYRAAEACLAAAGKDGRTLAVGWSWEGNGRLEKWQVPRSIL